MKEFRIERYPRLDSGKEGVTKGSARNYEKEGNGKSEGEKTGKNTHL